MYSVSSTFLQKMKLPAQRRRLYGTVGQISFTQANVVKGSFTISNQCSGDQNILIGQVYIGELKATLKNLEIARNGYKGLEIVSYNGLEISDNQYEDVLLGHYFIDSAKWTSSGITIVAYDAMAKFDKPFIEDTLQGTIYSMLVYACVQCGVVFGMTEEQIASFPNGTGQRTLYSINDIETYRDLISWCAQTLGANATINRYGQLVLRMFNQTIVDTLTTKDRGVNCQIYDYETFYTGILVVNMAEQTTSYYGLEFDDGLTMNLGSNPLVQYGGEQQLETQRRAILDAIAVARYTPTKISALVPMVYDLMDSIAVSGGLVGNESIVTCITKFSWTFNGVYSIECTGTDPTVADAKSKMDKHLQGLLASAKQDTIEYYLFTNVEDINIADGEQKKIVDIRFASNKSTVAVFHAEITLEAETSIVNNVYYDAIATITYRYNDINIDTYHPKETWVDGHHVLHLLYYFEIQTAIEARLEVLMDMAGGSVKIKSGNIRSSVYGQSLAATDRWDGNIDIRQEVTRMEMLEPTAIVMRDLAETISCVTQTPIGFVVTQEIGKISMASPIPISMFGISEIISAETTEV